MTLIIEASVVLFPEPVGPVTKTRPRGLYSNSRTDGGNPISSRRRSFWTLSNCWRAPSAPPKSGRPTSPTNSVSPLRTSEGSGLRGGLTSLQLPLSYVALPPITALDGPGSDGLILRQSYTVTQVRGHVRTNLGTQTMYAVPSNVGPLTMPSAWICAQVSIGLTPAASPKAPSPLTSQE